MIAIQFVQTKNEFDIKLWLLCQKEKPKEKTSNNEKDCSKLVDPLNISKDAMIDLITNSDLSKKKYHLNIC